MSHDIRDRLGFAFTTASLLISLYQLWNGASRRRHCGRVRYRSFKVLRMEWTAYGERDDHQS